MIRAIAATTILFLGIAIPNFVVVRILKGGETPTIPEAALILIATIIGVFIIKAGIKLGVGNVSSNRN